MKHISMKPVLFTLLAASALTLSGCSKQAAETVPAPATTEAPSSVAQTQTQPPATTEEPASSEAAESLTPESTTSESTASPQTQSIPEPILLDPDTDYYYDLDSDGTEEQISYTIRSVDEWNQAPALFINGQEQIYSSSSEIYGHSSSLYLMDLDTTDGLLDLHLECFSDSDTLSLYNFLQYKNGTLINLGDLAGVSILHNLGDIFRLDASSLSVPGNGTIQIYADTPLYSPSIGCYFCGITFQLQNGKLTEVPQDEYDIYVFDPQQTYKAKRDFTAALSPGAAEAAYSIATDQAVTIHKICFIGDVLYAQVTNESGQTGWILCNEEYFYETPAWG